MIKSPIVISDFEELAKEKLTQSAYDYYRSGADDEITLRENCAAFDRILLKYRVLIDVSNRELSTRILGKDISMPVIIAPTAFHKLAHEEGETATARAAGIANTIMILSTLSNSDVEDVVKASSSDIWFQLYVFRNRDITEYLVRRAEAAGCKAIVVTVDAPLLGRRIRDIRNSFNLPEGVTLKNLEPFIKDNLPKVSDSGLAGYVIENLDPSMTWKDIHWLKSLTKLPVMVKGIICKEDALLALENSVDGIVVSNHGGRQLDTCSATIDALPSIAECIENKIPLFVDGGIRRGTDIIKALALGADAVLTGRPVVFGLAYNGHQGVVDVLTILRNELDLAMALCGCSNINEISGSLIA